MDVKAELNDLKEPAMVAGLAVGVCFIAKKLTGYSIGVETHSMVGAAKAFALITASGGAVTWYIKKN